MRSFALTAITLLTLGAFSTAAPTPIARELVDANVKAGVKVGRGHSEGGGSLIGVDADIDIDILRRGQSGDSGSLIGVDADVDVDILRRGNSGESGSLIGVDADVNVDVLKRGHYEENDGSLVDLDLDLDLDILRRATTTDSSTDDSTTDPSSTDSSKDDSSTDPSKSDSSTSSGSQDEDLSLIEIVDKVIKTVEVVIDKISELCQFLDRYSSVADIVSFRRQQG